MMQRLRRNAPGALGLIAVLAVVPACSDDATGPDGEATMSVVATDDPSSQSASMTKDVVLAGFLAQQSGASYSGQFTANAQVQVSTDGSTYVDVGPPQQVTVQLQSSDGSATIHTDAALEAQSYSRVRLVLEGAQASLDAGSEVGTTVLDAALSLDVGGGSQVVIERQASVDVGADSETTLVFDVNSEAWVTEENAQAEAVAASEVESATTVSIR